MSMKSRLRTWLNDDQAAPGPLDDYWYSPRGLASTDAMAVAAVYRCVNFLSTLVAGLPFQVYKRNESDDGRTMARNHPLYHIIHNRPHERYSAFEYWEAVMWSLLIHGNAVSIQEVNARNDVTSLTLLDWSKVTVALDPKLKVRVFNYVDGTDRRQFVDTEVFYIPGPGYDGMKSPSPIETHKNTIGLSRAALDYVLGYFERGAIPPAYLAFPNNVSEAKLTEWYNWFRKKFMGKNAGALGVVPNGGEIKTVQLHHREMQLVELRQEQVVEVCRIFGIPPHIAFELTRSTNNNIENQDIGVAKYTVKPWTKRIESRANMSLLGPEEGRRYFTEFNLMAITEGDAESQSKLMAAEIQNAVRTPNEWRAIRNLPPLPGGDDLYMQGAMAKLEDLPTLGEEPETKEESANAA